MISGKSAPVKAGRRPLSISFMQMVFEEYGFKSFLAMPAQPLSLLEWQAQQPRLPANSAGIGLVIDAGVHRFHRIPFFWVDLSFQSVAPLVHLDSSQRNRTARRPITALLISSLKAKHAALSLQGLTLWMYISLPAAPRSCKDAGHESDGAFGRVLPLPGVMPKKISVQASPSRMPCPCAMGGRCKALCGASMWGARRSQTTSKSLSLTGMPAASPPQGSLNLLGGPLDRALRWSSPD